MHDLSLYLLEVLENSVRAGATRIDTTIVADRVGDRLTIAVEDDGPGLPVRPDQALDPFFTTKHHKKTGLGLSLFRQAAEDAGGELVVGRSERLGGARVCAGMSLSNVDRPPLGDVAATFATMVVTNPAVMFGVELRDEDSRVTVHGAGLPSQLLRMKAYQRALR